MTAGFPDGLVREKLGRRRNLSLLLDEGDWWMEPDGSFEVDHEAMILKDLYYGLDILFHSQD